MDEIKDFDLGIDLNSTESTAFIGEPIPEEKEEKKKSFGSAKKEFVIKRLNSGRNGFILVLHDNDQRLLPVAEWPNLQLREMQYEETKFKKLDKPKWRK